MGRVESRSYCSLVCLGSHRSTESPQLKTKKENVTHHPARHGCLPKGSPGERNALLFGQVKIIPIVVDGSSKLRSRQKHHWTPGDKTSGMAPASVTPSVAIISGRACCVAAIDLSLEGVASFSSQEHLRADRCEKIRRPRWDVCEETRSSWKRN